MPSAAQTKKELPDEALVQLGTRTKSLRTERKMTLAELSLKSQISVGMLSLIERGQTSPSLKTLERLRVALNVPLSRFFGDEQAQAVDNDVVVRSSNRRQLPFPAMGLTKELLSPPGHPGLEMLVLDLEPGGSSGLEPWTRRGEKAGMVLQGRFELNVGANRHVIEENDSFQFDGRNPHSFRNLAKGRTRVLWVIKADDPG
jgi:transcriptional regulator with XRE-family HTH domain